MHDFSHEKNPKGPCSVITNGVHQLNYDMLYFCSAFRKNQNILILSFLFFFKRKSVTENRTSVMTWTWTLPAVRAAPVCLVTQPAALESKLTPASTASPQRWPPWRKTVSGKDSSVSAWQSAAAARVPPGSMPAVRLEKKMKGGEKKVRGFKY